MPIIKITIFIVFLISACSKPYSESEILPYQFLNDITPDSVPIIYAPNIISLEDRYEFGITISKDGREILFGVDPIFDLQTPGVHKIWRTAFEDGSWSEPEIFLTHPEFTRNDPMFSPNEDRIYFISNQPDEGEEIDDVDLWYIQKRDEDWSEPINLGSTINSEFDEFYSSFTSDGSMYFASNAQADENSRNYDIHRAQWNNGIFEEPVAQSDSINTRFYEGDVFVSPDESYIIFAAARRGGFGRGDLYISFKNETGEWKQAKNMGELINTENHELCPYITPDGKYLMYTSNKEIYWVSTNILDRYK